MSNKFSFPVDKSINKILDFFIFIGEHKYPIIKQVALDHCGLFQKLYNEASNSITIEYEDYHKEFQAIANLFCYSILTFTSLNINYVIQAAEFFEIPELFEAAVAFKEEQDRLEVILSQPNELENLIQLKTAVFNINEANFQMAKENIANFVQSKYDIRIVAKLIYKACFARSSKIPILIKLVSELESIQHRFIKLVLRDFFERNEVALPNEINFILFYLLENNVQKDFILQSISEKAQKMKFWVHLTNPKGHEDHIDLIRKGENPDSIPNAIRNDDCELLQQLIASLNFDINGRATSSIYEICSFINKKPTLIEYASFYGAINCFKYLLLSGAKLPRYIFEIAVAGGNSEIIHLITQNENFFLSNNAAYNSILFHRLELFEWLLTNYPTGVKNYEVLAVKCIEESSFDIFQQFLREGTNPNGLPTAPIPLAAIKNDNLRLVDFLFRIEQVDVNITDRNGHTVLHLACLENKPDIVKFLLNIPRIEKNARNRYDLTPLALCCQNDLDDIVKILIEYPEIDVNATSMGGQGISPLQSAAKSGNAEIVTLLLKRPEVKINQTTFFGRKTALHYACEGGHYDAVKALLSCKDIQLLDDNTFKTPVDYASDPRIKNLFTESAI